MHSSEDKIRFHKLDVLLTFSREKEKKNFSPENKVKNHKFAVNFYQVWLMADIRKFLKISYNLVISDQQSVFTVH